MMGPFRSWTLLLAVAACGAGGSVFGQASIRSRDLASDWAGVATLNPGTANVPSWNSQPNSWRLGVAIENVDTGVMLTDVEPGMPAQRAGLEKGDIIVSVAGYQIGYVNGALYDLGEEIRKRADQQGRVNFLVYDQRTRLLQNLPVTLVQQSSGGVRGEVVCRERITLTQQAVLTVRLRDVTFPTWQSVKVGEHVIPQPKHPPIPFSISINPSDIFPDHKYEVDAYLVDRGQIVLQSSAGVPVNPLSNNSGLQVNLVRVGNTAPPNTTYAVGKLEQINQWYRQYLRRDALPQELAAWQSHLQAGRAPQEIQAYLLGSSEYFDKVGNARDPYIAEVLRLLTGRQPTAAEIQQYSAQYQQYGGARTDFVRDILRMQPNGL